MKAEAFAFASQVEDAPEHADNPWDTPSSLALFTAQRFVNAERKASALIDIAATQVAARDMGRALSTLTLSLDAAQHMSDERDMPYVLSRIAVTQMEAGDKKQATATLKQALKLIQEWNAVNKEPALRHIVPALAKVGEINQAVELAETTKKTALLKITLKRRIVRALVEAGQIKHAVELAQKIEPAAGNSSSLRFIVEALANSGDTKQAVEVAQLIRRRYFKAAALIDVASIQGLAGAKEPALATLKQAAELARNESRPNMAGLLGDIAGSQVDAGAKDEALMTLKEVNKIAQTFSGPSFRDSSLKDVAVTLAKAGEINTAVNTAQQIEAALTKATALKDIASNQIVADDTKQASATLHLAADAARNIKNASSKASTLRDISQTLAEVGEVMQAKEIALTIGDAKLTARALIKIALMQLEVGEKEKMLATIQEAAEAADRIENEFTRVSVMSSIAATLARAGRIEQAVKKALAVENAIDKDSFLREIAPTFKDSALRSVALAIAQNGRIEQAGEVVVQIDDTDINASAISQIAMSLATTPVPDDGKNKRSRNNLGRMKSSFTPQEKQQAKQLVVMTLGN